MSAFFIIVLDKNNSGREGIWYVTASAPSIEPLLAVTQHDDTIGMQLQQSIYPGAAVRECALLNVPLNRIEQGDIYEVRHV
jgi:hypothetical protein